MTVHPGLPQSNIEARAARDGYVTSSKDLTRCAPMLLDAKRRGVFAVIRPAGWSHYQDGGSDGGCSLHAKGTVGLIPKATAMFGTLGKGIAGVRCPQSMVPLPLGIGVGGG